MRTLACALLLIACDGEIELPGPVPGGGVDDWDPGMAQSVVYVVDARDVPLEGIEVHVEGDSIGTTDADGAVRFEGIGESFTAFDGDRAVTVFHPFARAVTIPMFDEEPPRATVSATLDGFGSIPFEGDYLIARAGFTFTSQIAARENFVVPLDDEVTSCEGATCTVRLATRTGALRVFVAIAEGFDEGTVGDREDDRLEPVAIAISDVVELDEGDEREVSLALLDADDVVRVEITPDETPPAGFDRVVGVPGALTEAGVLVWPHELGSSALIPRTIEGETAAHWAIGAVIPSPIASSSSIRRGLTFTGDVTASDDLPTPPDAVSVRNRTILMMPGTVGDGVLTRFEIEDQSGALVWIGYQMLESVGVAPPAELPLPASGTARATVIQHPENDPSSISIRLIEERFTQSAARSTDFGPDCPWAECL